MEQVLKLDADCEEAVNDLLYCKVQQLVVNERLVLFIFIIKKFRPIVEGSFFLHFFVGSWL